MNLELLRILPSLLPAELFQTSAPPNLSHKVRSDPLGVLPFDILYNVFQYLPVEDALKLMQASWHVFSLTRNRSFWRQMTRLHLMPWFWELTVHHESHPDIDYKGMFLWLEKTTRPKYGIEGPFIGIANRRRIWNVCKQLAPSYQLKANPTEREEPDYEEAKAIRESAVTLHMPLTMYPQPKEARNVCAQFIRSWNEVTYHPSDLETYFNETGALIGISVIFGKVQRLFGSNEGTKGQSMHIPANDWIEEIVVFINNIDMFERHQDRDYIQRPQDSKPFCDSVIRALQVCFQIRILKNCCLNRDRFASNQVEPSTRKALTICGATSAHTLSCRACLSSV
jgi:hypothetical protein